MKNLKGSIFEREVCKTLSLWWTEGERDDIYWRTHNSGGRATTRAKKGQGTYGQAGDVQAVDPIGQPFLDLCSIEIKRGYSKNTIADMLDNPASGAKQAWELWASQAITDKTKSNSFAWFLITKRDRRIPLVFMPWWLYSCLYDVGCEIGFCIPNGTMNVKIGETPNMIFVCTFENFLKNTTQAHIKKCLKIAKKRKRFHGANKKNRN